MDQRAFQKILQRTFGGAIEVREDPRDHCMVVWDKTVSGVPYPVHKVACNTNVPSYRGERREAYDRDIQAIRRMTWHHKFNRRRSAGKQVIDEFYREPQKRRDEELERNVHEVAQGEVRDKAMWQAGVRNSIDMGATDKAGGMKNRMHDRKRRIKERIGDTPKAAYSHSK